MNIVVLEGVLSRPCLVRELPSGSLLCTLEVTTRDPQGAATSVPVTWFDPPSAPAWDTGAAVVVVGSVRRRFFRTAASTQSRTEVVAEAVALVEERRKAGRVRDRARRAVEAALT
jgi:single-strand DNA-binding protein